MRKGIVLMLLTLLNLSIYAQDKTHSGFDVGYSHKGFIPITVYYGAEKTQFGLTVGIPANTGTKGEYHPAIYWKELPKETDVVKDGEYYLPFMFNISQPVSKNLYIGGGVGYTFKTLYRNMYDESEDIGEYGRYYITARGRGQIDYIMFFNYIVPFVDEGNLSIRIFCSGLMGAGASFGYAF